MQAVVNGEQTRMVILHTMWGVDEPNDGSKDESEDQGVILLDLVEGQMAYVPEEINQDWANNETRAISWDGETFSVQYASPNGTEGEDAFFSDIDTPAQYREILHKTRP